MATIKMFTDLEIRKKARALENKIFHLTGVDLLAKDIDLKNQMNRSSGSIMDNVEGFGRGRKLEFIQFLTLARGSTAEPQSQLYRCLDRKYIIQDEFDKRFNDCEKLVKMITGFIEYLNKTEYKGQKFKNRL